MIKQTSYCSSDLRSCRVAYKVNSMASWRVNTGGMNNL